LQASADLAVVVLGEENYTEKPGDISDLSLHRGQLSLARAVAATGVPTVLVLIQGRPRILHGLAQVRQRGWGARINGYSISAEDLLHRAGADTTMTILGAALIGADRGGTHDIGTNL
jgi:hypothetical protein